MQSVVQLAGRPLVQHGALAEAVSNIVKLPQSVIAATVMINILGLALPLAILQVYDRILANHSLGTLLWLMIALCAVIVLEAVLKLLRFYLMSWSATKAAFISESDAVGRILSAPATDVESDNPTSWMNRFDSLEQYNNFKSGQSLLVLIDLPFLIIYLAIILMVAGPLVLPVITVVTGFTLFVMLKAAAMRKILLKRVEHDHRRYDFIVEALTGIEAIKSMAMEPQMQRRLERLQTSSADIMFERNLLGNELTTIVSLMTNVILIVVVSTGALMVIDGALSIGALACTTMLTSRLVQPIMRFIPACLELESARIAKDRTDRLFEIGTSGSSSTTEDLRSNPIEGRIEVKNLRFSYPGMDRPLISIESLDIEPGEIVGVKGDQSIGKTTLLNLLSGQLNPSSGRISVDGIDIRGPLQHQLASWISHARHDSEIFQGTILENITMFRGGQIVSRARAAAELIGLEDAINRLPAGFDTRLGSGASDQLPAGLLQQITVARALAAEPKILLFDEANSLLDFQSDKALKDGLSRLRGQMTQILITNRPSFLAIADRVFELRNGELV
ncbi:MAG: peptidase domain-containing ABC transporter, partial [Hyphomicrobiaceae bacterium]